MLYLLFNIRAENYALAADQVIQVLPAAQPRRVRGAPAFIEGTIAFRGQNLPVIDLVKLETGHPAAIRMGTRIIVVATKNSENVPLQVGLILENATQTFRTDPHSFSPFAQSSRGPVQLMDIDLFLPPSLFDGFSLEAGIAS